ncbi:hypothetical protein E1B28_002743 [Marasmius oreades]|uniref:Uncharacterized protein n=1 Tax=Marasmius oreades TaxID=181124 RepID=A0A9P7UL59_9AGAR|nr:uncharacterized protein E1B28_002743 [Marasmius oreades]KAG7086822.1 hypothetical protein E1B28_002743 [Marasmius oreades]
MSSGRFFEGASRIQFYGGQSFTNANNIINNYNSYISARPELEHGLSISRRDDDQWLTLVTWRTKAQIDMCDILILCEVSSETHHVSVKLKTTNPFRNRVGGVVKIRKRTQIAEIVPGFEDRRFTVVSLEPEDGGDVEKIWRILEPLCETALSQRQVWLTQIFGVGRSMTPTLIYHDEAIDVETIIEQCEKTPIVWTYLFYRFNHSFFDVVGDEALQKLAIPLASGWTFNLKTRSFQYDIVAVTSDDDEDRYYFDRLPPLPHNCNPPLDSNEIIHAIPNILQLVSSFRTYRSISSFVRHHDVLTFGTVHQEKPKMRICTNQ